MSSPTEEESGISSHAFFLADFAAVESGKAYVSGGFWDRMTMPEFPSMAFFSVVAVIDVPWSAYHAVHNFSITVEDEGGNALEPHFDGEFQVITAAHMKVGDPTIMPLAATLNGMSIDGPGDLSFILRIDGAEVDRWPLRVALADGPEEPEIAARPFEPPGAPPRWLS